MIKAKELKTTPSDIEAISKDISRILYAEWAEPGAMGCSGSARVYMLEGEDLIRYIAHYPDYYDIYTGVFTLINYMSNNTRVIYDSPPPGQLEKLDEAINAGKIPKPCFRSVYGGFGNYAWLNTGATLVPDDENLGLIYHSNGKDYIIECSVDGVYSRVKGQLLKQYPGIIPKRC